ncbi:MAG: hypothetical protein IPN69_15175 [Acidobacteria bacterium]|nr:hypothetical protein [Acidobacteriota bacterium]MBK8147769.1 hypothetical protein [Acidobacteriota bacterium]MBK8812053.1 hypothetical protein [Acidobacteriota bacterium]
MANKQRENLSKKRAERFLFALNLTAIVLSVLLSATSFGVGAAWWVMYRENRFIQIDDNPFHDLALRLIFVSLLYIGSLISRRLGFRFKFAGILLLIVAFTQCIVIGNVFRTRGDEWLVEYSHLFGYYPYVGALMVVITSLLLLADLVFFSRQLWNRFARTNHGLS